jgi:diguanylate cyclase (GGDEF)-like protein
MSRSHATPPRAGPLRRHWIGAFGLLVALLVVAGMMTFVLTDGLVGRFTDGSRELDRAETTSAQLEQRIVAHQDVAQQMIDGRPANRARFLAGQTTITRMFDSTRARFSTAHQRALLDRARREWQASLTQSGFWNATPTPPSATAAVALHFALARRTGTIAATLAQLDAASRSVMRGRVRSAHDLATIVLIIVAMAFLLAVAVTGFLVRGLSRNVLRPVDDLRTSVGLIRSGDLAHRVEVDRSHSANELTDLAVAFNEMAAALSASHDVLSYQAQHDNLTGLANRKAFNEHLLGAFSATGDRRADGVSVLFIDIDDFKRVNDTLGHAAGDQLLATIADRLRETTRPGDYVARLGGDEFAVVIEGPDPARIAGATAERMLQALAQPAWINDTNVPVSVSVGVANRHADDRSPDDLVSHADYAMYTAKRAGKARYDVFERSTVTPPSRAARATPGAR